MIYFVVFLLSAACLFVSTIYWPEYAASSIFLILSIGVLATQVKVNLKNIPDRMYSLLLAVPAILLAVIVPFPYNLGLLFLSIGIILTVLFPLKKHAVRFGISLITIGLILTFVSLFNPLFNIILSRFHDFSLLNIFIDPILKLFGLNSIYESGNLYIQSVPSIEWILTTTEKTGIYFSFIFFIGATIIILLFRKSNKSKAIISLIIIQFLYLILRYAFIIIVFLNAGRADIFWDRWLEILSFLPLVFILYKFIPLKSQHGNIQIRFERFSYSKKFIPATIYIALFVFITSALFLFHDPGKHKKGRVLLDEHHSDWEWTEEKLDTTWYGKKSLYNYYCLADYVSHYYQFERNFKLITGDLLKDFDILIIKTPTSSFSEDEIKAIENFVYDGGGLLLIGDHTNVFGTSTFINPIAKRFGLKFNYDATYDFKTGSLSVYETPLFYSHPVVQSMPPFLFGTSCTLEAPFLAENIIIGYGIKAAYLDYSRKNFFSTHNESANMKYGLFLQSAGIKHGKGRVLAFTDSTVFSNFWMFMPGKPELFLGFLNWLNRINTFFSLKIIFFFLGLLFLWITKIQLKTFNSFQKIFLISIAGGLTFVFSYLIFSSIKTNSYELPGPHTAYYKICIDNEYSDIDMPIISLTEDYNKSYNTLFILLQRLGYFPSISGSIEESLDKNDLVIIINAKKKIPEYLNDDISAFLKDGGKLLILEEHTVETKLLANFIDIEPQKPMPNLSKYEIGNGEIYVLHNSILYNDINLGIANAVPNQDQIKNIRSVYHLIDLIVNVD